MATPAFTRWFVRIAAGLSALLVLLVLLAYWLTATDTGFRTLLSLADRLPGVSVSATGLSGTPGRGLGAATLSIDLERVRIEIGNLKLRLRPVSLVGAKVDLDYARADSIRVFVKPRLHPPEHTPPGFMPRGTALIVQRLEVGKLSVSDETGELWAASRLTARVAVSHGAVRLLDATADAGSYAFMGNAILTAADPIIVSSDAMVSVPTASSSAKISVAVRGNLETLSVAAVASAPRGVRFAGTIDLHDTVKVAGRLVVGTEDLTPLVTGSPVGRIDSNLEMTYHGGAFELSGPFSAAGLPVGPMTLLSRGSYRHELLTVDELTLRQLKGAAVVAARGRVNLAHAPQIDADLRWQDLGWPAVGKPDWLSPKGTLTVTGTPASMDYRLGGELSGARLPPARFDATGTVTPASLEVATYRIQMLGGDIDGKGSLAFTGTESWSVTATGHHLDPGGLRPPLHGQIDFRAQAAGRGLDPKGDWQASLDALSGRIRNHPVHGKGAVTMSHGELGIDRAHLELASLRADADGRLGKARSLDVHAELGDLGEFVADGAGRLTIRGQLRATAGAQALQGRVDGHGLRIGPNRIGQVSADADLDSARSSDSRLAVEIHQLHVGGKDIDSVTLAGDGTAASHVFSLHAQGGNGDATLSGRGNYSNRTESLLLDTLDVKGPGLPELTLLRPSRLTVGASAVSLEETCAHAGDMRACAAIDWRSAGPWTARLDLNAIPANLLPVTLSRGSALMGNLSLTANAHGEPSHPPQGTADVQLNAVGLRYRLQNGADRVIMFGSGRIEAQATERALAVTADLSNSSDTYLNLTATAPRDVGRALPDEPLDGHLKLRTRELNLVALALRDLDRLDGLVEADLHLGGTVGAPKLDGNVVLTEGEADVYLSNLRLKQISASATLKDNRLELEGTAHAGAGILSANGGLAWVDGSPAGLLRFKGENLVVVDLPEAHVVASPDISLALSARKLEIRGTVRIPSARIVPKDMSAAVRVSEDQVLVGGNHEGPDDQMKLDTVVTLNVGPDVRLAAYGLKGLLQGSVTVTTRTDEAVTGSGELVIKDGRYLAYARELDIELGRLIFRGGPVDDAGLDVRASKKLPGYTAGVNVRGTLQSPKLSFFSDPPLPQSQIASLLIVGQSPDSPQNGAAAAGSLLAAQGSAFLVGDYTHYLGIDQMTIEADANNGTALVLGKFLTPRLYASYGISLAEAINTLKLRYTVGDNWVINMESGLDYSVDMQYSFKR